MPQVRIKIEATAIADKGEGLYVNYALTSGGVGGYTWLKNDDFSRGVVAISDALEWVRAELRNKGYETTTEPSYNTADGKFVMDVAKVLPKPKVSEIRNALRPILGDAVDKATNLDIYLAGYRPRVEFYGGVDMGSIKIEAD